MVPYALGQNIEFLKDDGPQLSEFSLNTFINNDEKKFSRKLEPVYKAIEITRNELDKKKSLISFVGAPWTLLIYMLKLKKSKTEIDINKLNNSHSTINKILNDLNRYIMVHINNQIKAGADVVQIFDSWAGLAPNENLNSYIFKPNAKIIDFCKKGEIPAISYPKGIKEKYEDFNKIVKPDGINIDPEIDPLWAKEKLKNVVIQGGIDPKILLKSEEDIIETATKYIQTFKEIPYVLNLGHGLLPETDPVKVSKLISFYRNSYG